MTHEAEPIEALEVHVEPTRNSIGGILRLAVEKGAPIDTIERLVALTERADARYAAAEFNQALADFQAECPAIQKKSTAKITPTSGSQFAYKYAELDEIARVIRPLLTKHGLSYSWDSDIKDGKFLICTCKLGHIAGHSVTAQFVCPTESNAGMSAQQKVASALTFARRQSLVQVLGLTTTEADLDGASAGAITPEQAHTIEEWISKCPAPTADRARFLDYMKVAAVESIAARDYQKAITALKAKAKTGGAS